MKKFILLSLILLLGCQQNTSPEEIHADIQTNDFIDPNPTQWVEYIKPVRKYMYYRTQAVLHNDISILWEQYPALKEGADLKKGINQEGEVVESLNNGFDFIDSNFALESYEKIKIKEINEQEVVVLVHGSIGYIRKDFTDSGGEHLIKVFIERKGSGWQVVKTDEYLLHEYKEWIKSK